MKKFYEDFDLTNAKKENKAKLNKQEVRNLFKRPPKERKKEMGDYNFTYEPNMHHQADLLFLPDDEGYRYALVVVDLATHLCDSCPLKNKFSSDVKDAFETIYDRGIIEMPKILTMDSGTEFKGDVLKYLKDNNVRYRYGKPKRHRQLAVVERTNQYLAKGLFMRMTAQELLTGEPSREWIEDLPKFVEYINKKRKREPPKEPKSVKSRCSGDDCTLLDIGTKVRTKLDHPLDAATDKTLHGKFRITDIRWDPVVRTITNIILHPNQPPFYQLDDKKRKNGIDVTAMYTKKQLQVVPEGEETPSTSVIRGTPTGYRVEKLLQKKKEKNRIYFLVKWRGFPDSQATWELRTELNESVPELVKEFEKSG